MPLKSGTETSSAPAALEVFNLCKDYRVGTLRRKVGALREVSFSVREGRIFGLLGPNGSGKTTLLKIVTGLARPTRGDFRVLGRRLDGKAKARLGFLPDKPHHYPFLTPWETLSFYADIFGMTGRTKGDRIEEVLSLVKMGEKKDLRLRYFSKGMLQRVALAQAILNDPDLLILDEPTGALDPWGIRLMKDIFRTMKNRGKTVVFSSHLLNYAQEICEDFLILEKGRVVTQGALPGDRNLEDIFLSTVPESG